MTKTQELGRARTERILTHSAQVVCLESLIGPNRGLSATRNAKPRWDRGRRHDRRVKPEPNPDSRANDEAGNGPAIGENYVNLQPHGEQIAPNTPSKIPRIPPASEMNTASGQKLPENIAAAGANRFANSNLFRPLGHAHQHDVHDANAGGDQRDKANHECANTDDAGNIHESALERVVGVNLEIVSDHSLAARARSASRPPLDQRSGCRCRSRSDWVAILTVRLASP